MVYYAAVLITCLIFLCKIVHVTTTLEGLNSHVKRKVPNNTVIRVFNNDYNCNIWRNFNQDLSATTPSTSKNKKTHFHSNSTWISNTLGDPYFDGYLDNLTQKKIDKVGLFKAIKKILNRNLISSTENLLTECEITDCNSYLAGRKKQLRRKDYLEKKDNAAISNLENLPLSEDNITAIQLITNLENASQHLEGVAQKIEDELDNLYKIRLHMEKSMYHKAENWGKSRKWREWSAWSACSVTCGIGTQVRDRIASIPERGRPTIEIEMKPCRLPDCSPASVLFCSANNLLRSLISFKNYTHDNE